MPVQPRMPDTVTQAIRLPEERIERELSSELALPLYTQNLL